MTGSHIGLWVRQQPGAGQGALDASPIRQRAKLSTHVPASASRTSHCHTTSAPLAGRIYSQAPCLEQTHVRRRAERRQPAAPRRVLHPHSACICRAPAPARHAHAPRRAHAPAAMRRCRKRRTASSTQRPRKSSERVSAPGGPACPGAGASAAAAARRSRCWLAICMWP